MDNAQDELCVVGGLYRRSRPSNLEHPSCNAAMLDLGLAAALEVLHAAVGGEASRVPKSDGILNTKLVLERSERRGGVVGPVTPGASGQAVL